MIGENRHHLGEEVKARHPDLPWEDIYGMRHIIAHDYGWINPATVWNVARDYLAIVRNIATAELDRALEAPSPAREPAPERQPLWLADITTVASRSPLAQIVVVFRDG